MQARNAALLILLGSVACAQPRAELSAEHAAAIADSARVFLADFTRLSENARWDSLAALYSKSSTRSRTMRPMIPGYANTATILPNAPSTCHQ